MTRSRSIICNAFSGEKRGIRVRHAPAATAALSPASARTRGTGAGRPDHIIGPTCSICTITSTLRRRLA
ncbi:fatty-acid-CoA ligase domain protein [Mycobacterium ulcerans str. Harvey]|uniref:Fatty-acid-CoA ligase domain protein n=1 Tax=Mycobacterium ulcerans str. Harvey TaxID=1299332 RepID=A0ABP3AS53_MYCUL|nr:fatty-acid-CoA ligase domain protein [Mycobacterium ulcerans str. Harvey]